jgi:CRISPR-associated endonuclease/helicase Cas3
MTVPTGGGKTLSALAFAFEHARRNNLRRVIYVAPYLSILEQNVREIRRALGVDATSPLVFEHHSLSEPLVHADDFDAAQTSARLRRAENWDAPVVATTNVQFFESLFANQPGQCRKLHNTTRSVVILDECQTLPPQLIAPTCAMLNQWAQTAGTSIVLCTATQPAWLQRPDLPTGLVEVREIAPQQLQLFPRLRRAVVTWP